MLGGNQQCACRVTAECFGVSAECFGGTRSVSGGYLQHVSVSPRCVFWGILAACFRDLRAFPGVHAACFRWGPDYVFGCQSSRASLRGKAHQISGVVTVIGVACSRFFL